jgi:alkanesulfonate monooxygenase SsuD/methylene tetrahydromethanopterin reductase-like flavin-dependent oxidoreductase (luciferase family)
VLLAKSLATGDMLCGGRLTVGVGVGGRQEDYLAVGADPSTQTMREMAQRVEIMKRVWAGEKITESVLPVGPVPVHSGGPRLLVGTIGPKTLRSAAPWADGLAGITLDLDVAKQDELFEVGRTAWAQAGKPKPHLATSFWFALGSPVDSRAQIHRHLRHYMNWIPGEFVDAMAPHTGFAGTEDELADVLGRFAAIGTSEIHLIPTSTDLDQLRRVADVVADFDTGTTP